MSDVISLRPVESAPEESVPLYKIEIFKTPSGRWGINFEQWEQNMNWEDSALLVATLRTHLGEAQAIFNKFLNELDGADTDSADNPFDKK